MKQQSDPSSSKVMRLTVFNDHVQHSLIHRLLSRNLDPKIEIYVSQSTDFKHYFCTSPVSHSSILSSMYLPSKETPDLLDYLRIEDRINKNTRHVSRHVAKGS